MNNSEIIKLHKSIATDFKLATRKTELWTIDYCYKILHDIKKLMTFGFLDNISLMLNDQNGVALKVKKYIISGTAQDRNDRPGSIDWEDGEGHSLGVLLIYNPTFLGLPLERRAAIQTEYLKLPWYNSSVNPDFPHLSGLLSKVYTESGSGIDRLDFN